jgi:hypothetical protein
MQQYRITAGQSFTDVCMNTYGSLDYYIKLLNDNNVSPDDIPYTNQVVTWDETIIADQTIYISTTQAGIIFATLAGDNDNIYYTIK